MDKATKTCDLVLHLQRGTQLAGRFHVPVRTGSTIRPSDAVREIKEGFLVLTDVVVDGATAARSVPVVMVPVAAIGFIELPPNGWSTR